MSRTTSIVILFVTIAVALSFTSCRTTMRLLGDRNADLRTGQRWASPVMAPKPVQPEQRTIWFRYRNLTQEDYDLSAQIRAALERSGYRLVEDPDQAHFNCYYTLRFFGENEKEDNGRTIAAGLGAVAGGAAGYGIASAAGAGTGGRVAGTVGGGTVGAIVGYAISNGARPIEYNLILDVRVAERKKGVVKATTRIRDQLRQTSGSSNDTSGGAVSGMQSTADTSEQEYRETTNMLWRENRLVLYAKQIGLEPQEAKPELEKALVKMLPQILP